MFPYKDKYQHRIITTFNAHSNISQGYYELQEKIVRATCMFKIYINQQSFKVKNEWVFYTMFKLYFL